VINVKYYEGLLQLEVFNFSDACKVIGKVGNTKVILDSYLEKGLIRRVRRGLFCAVNLDSRNAPANRYLVASKINEAACLSHHTAFELYGLTHQTSFVVYVESDKIFSDFMFEGTEFKYAGKGIKEGAVSHRQNSNIRVTDLERTIVESINRLDYCGGVHEFDEILKICPVIKEEKILKYLEIYNKQFLYKKAGYFLEKYSNSLGLTDELLIAIEKKAGSTKKYLSDDAMNGHGRLIKRWGLIVPATLDSELEEGDEFV
jgi:predicted transcriptional regulator of viral defense system